jgi:hypothetical protein
MTPAKAVIPVHPTGEGKNRQIVAQKPAVVETFNGRIHVEWSPDSAVTPLGQLPFFIEFLKTADLFDPWVAESPLHYASPNAPDKRDILGTLMLSILAGHQRYAHITAMRCDRVNPALLGMKKVVSEDSMRRAFGKNCNEEPCHAWMSRHLQRCYEPLLYEPWILDIDTSVKPLYGKQEGAVVGYNPKKPGRPSHAYHSYFMANTRLCLDVELAAGNETNASYSGPGLWKFLDGLPMAARPTFVRGDIGFGQDAMIREAEKRLIDYLFKIKQTARVKELVEQLRTRTDWESCGQGWEGLESELKLQGWKRFRRVIILRRRLRNNVMSVTHDKKTRQPMLTNIEVGEGGIGYEYAALVTSLTDDLLTVAQHYRDRADCENNFDELKNHWGWGGFTTQDMKRSKIMSRMTALIYNWWTLFTRMAIPDKHAEAITSRPLLLHAIGQQVEHGRQKSIRITSMHGSRAVVEKALRKVSSFLRWIHKNAEQLSWMDRWRLILSRIFVKFLKGKILAPPPFLSAPC